MRKPREVTDYLWDMYENVQKAQAFIRGYSFTQFEQDERIHYAVVRALEIIGESASKIPQDIQNLYGEIPWREISGMRNKLIHDYFGVDLAVVWQTVKEDLPNLQTQLAAMLRDFGEEAPRP